MPQSETTHTKAQVECQRFVATTKSTPKALNVGIKFAGHDYQDVEIITTPSSYRKLEQK